MHRCVVCDKEIDFEIDGPVYAFDPPNGTMIAAFYCGGCGEECHDACAGHKCESEGFCPPCWTRYGDDSALAV